MSLTKEENENLMKKFDEFLQTNNIQCEDFLSEFALNLRAQAETQSHIGVKSCLEGCADDLDYAALAFYASLK